MMSQVGAMTDPSGSIPDDPSALESRDVLLWVVAAFAMGVLSAWIGALAWIVATFLTS